jgi:hypothetical protein
VKGVSFLGRIQGTVRAVILHWYYQDGINDCDFAEMMPGRRVTVDSPTIFCWVQRYAPGKKGLVTDDRDPLLLKNPSMQSLSRSRQARPRFRTWSGIEPVPKSVC